MSVGISSRARVAVTSFSLLCVSLLLTAYSAKNRSFGQLGEKLVAEGLSPLQALVHLINDSGASIWDRYLFLVGVQGENEELRARLERLEGDLALLQEFKGENERLRKLLEFSKTADLNGVVGSVVGYDPSGWVKGIVVNKGSSSGISAGMAVVHARGVVGQVVSTSPSASRVLLINDHSSGVDALVQGSRARGVVEGSGSTTSELRYINRDTVLKAGELVLTSGMDGVFPKGLVIGTVSDVEAGGGGLFQTVEVFPAVDFSRLEEVLILTSLPVVDTVEAGASPVRRPREEEQ
jgi:rod shape-determining protein MreC